MKFRCGQLGWHMGYAVMILTRRKTKYGYVFVLAACDPKRPDLVWLESILEHTLEDDEIIGPDCNGDLPEKSWFKKGRN